jgi:hypothetical protein
VCISENRVKAFVLFLVEMFGDNPRGVAGGGSAGLVAGLESASAGAGAGGWNVGTMQGAQSGACLVKKFPLKYLTLPTSLQADGARGPPPGFPPRRRRPPAGGERPPDGAPRAHTPP